MKIETNETQIIPYSHHYRCFPQMIGSPVNQSVFMYLLDEYVYRLRVGGNTSFSVSANEISQKRNIDRRTAAKCLSALQVMGLIEVVESVCKVNADVFVSLITSFNKLVLTSDKLFFIEKLQDGDYKGLALVGYQELFEGHSNLLSLKNSLQNDDIYKNAQPCANMHTPEHKCIDKNAQGYAKMYSLVQKYTDIAEEIRLEVRGNMDKVEFIDEFKGYFMDFCSEDEFGRLVLYIFDDSKQNEVVFGPEFAIFMHIWHVQKCTIGCAKMHMGVCKNAHGGVQKCTTVNNIIKEIKEITGIEENSDENDDEEFPEIDIKNLDRSLSSYQAKKIQSRFPFFSVKEVDEYTSDIRNCIDRADKIYINQVWGILHECYDQEAILDESGKELYPASNNIENVSINKNRLFRDILLPAYNQTKEIIDAGIIEVKGEGIKITATIDDSPSIFDNIIDWEISRLSDDDYYIASPARVRNIFSETVEDKPARSTSKKDRADDLLYMQKIILMGDDDSLYTQLTSVELVIYNFLNEYFVIGDSGDVEEPKQKFISRSSLAVFYLDAKSKGISEPDFLQTLTKDKPEHGTGCLNLRQRMFSADNVRRWNKMHSTVSVVDEIDSDSLVAARGTSPAHSHT